MNYNRRRPRDPEPGDGNNSATLSTILSGRLGDPPENPKFTLTTRQLELQAQRDVAPFITRSNVNSHEGFEATKQGISANKAGDSLADDILRKSSSISHGSHTKPDPKTAGSDIRSKTTESKASQGSDDQKTFLRSMLQKANSQHPSETSGNSQKALLRKVLARTISGKTRGPSKDPPSSTQSKSGGSSSSLSFKNRLRKHAMSASHKSSNSGRLNTKDKHYSKDIEKSVITKVVNSMPKTDLGSATVRIENSTIGKLDLSPASKREVKLDTGLHRTKAYSADKNRQPQLGKVNTVSSLEDKRYQQSVPTVSPEYESFRKFLHKEAFAQHKLLWLSFSAVCRMRPTPSLPVISSFEVYKFDTNTRETLSVMNLHLKTLKGVECDNSTQLVNDRRYSKELAKLTKYSKPAKKIVDVQAKVIEQNETRDMILDSRSKSFSSNEVDDPPKTSGITSEKNNFRKSRGTNLLLRHRNMKSLTDTLSVSTDGRSTSEYTRRQKERDSSTPKSEITSSDFDNKSDPGLEVTLNQFRTSHDDDQTQSTSNEGGITWQKVQLRSVSSTDTSNAGSEKSVPWANVKLKPVESKDLSAEESVYTSASTAAGSDATEIDDKYANRDSSSNISAEKSVSKTHTANDDDDHNDREIVTQTSLTSTAAKSNDTKLLEIADVDIAGDSTVYKLVSDTINGQDIDLRMIVGKRYLVTTIAKEGQVGSDITWKLARGMVKSLKIDTASRQATLYSNNDKTGKTLRFASSGDCLGFASTIYKEMGDQAKESESIETNEEDDVFDSVRLEPVNDEEQNVLETYRRLRRSQPAELALQRSISIDKSIDSRIAGSVLSSNPITKSDPHGLTSGQAEMNTASKIDPFKANMNALKASLNLSGLLRSSEEDAVSQQSDMKDSLPQFVAANSLPSSPVSTMSSSIAPTVTESTKLSATCKLSLDEENIAKKYRHMLKLKIPIDAVRHSMMKDDVSARIVSSVIPEEEKLDSEEGKNDDKLSSEESETVEKYKKMLALRIPADAVRHRMMKEGASEKIINVVLKDCNTESDSTADTSTDTKKESSNILTEDEDNVAAGFRKMLKLLIPKEAVLDRMLKEGVDVKIIKAVVGTKFYEARTSNDDDASQDNSKSSQSKLVALHWTPLSGKALDNSVWKSNRARGRVAQPEGSDISKLVELFQKKTTQQKEKSTDDASTASGKAHLLDVTRSNNVAISLQAFKDFSHTELAEIIGFLDPLRKVKGERITFMKGLLPTTTEEKVIKAYTGSSDRLVPAELWFKKIINVNRIEAKVQILKTMEGFHSECNILQRNFSLLAGVCVQVMASTKLQDLLEMVLRIGNIMNEGTRTGGAAGFKFDSLLRLTQTKSSDGKTTVLDFVVNVFVAKGRRDTLDLLSDFPECQTASRMLIGDMVNETKNLQSALEQCEVELDQLKNDAHKSSNKGILKPIREAESNEDPRQNLLNMIKSRNESKKEDDTVSSKLDPRQNLLTSIKRRVDCTNLDDESGKSESNDGPSPRSLFIQRAEMFSDKNSIYGGIRRLESFIQDATNCLEEVTKQRQTALKSCNELSQYCGESGGHGATIPLLGVLAEFATNVSYALQKYDDEKVAETRRQKKVSGMHQNKESCDDSSLGTKKAGKPQGKLLVCLVDELLKNADAKMKDDFKKGFVYDNPNEELKQIYEKEKSLVTFSSVSKPSLVSAIHERRSSLNQDDVIETRNDLKKQAFVLPKLKQIQSHKRPPLPSRPEPTKTVALLPPPPHNLAPTEEIITDLTGEPDEEVLDTAQSSHQESYEIIDLTHVPSTAQIDLTCLLETDAEEHNRPSDLGEFSTKVVSNQNDIDEDLAIAITLDGVDKVNLTGEDHTAVDIISNNNPVLLQSFVDDDTSASSVIILNNNNTVEVVKVNDDTEVSAVVSTLGSTTEAENSIEADHKCAEALQVCDQVDNCVSQPVADNFEKNSEECSISTETDSSTVSDSNDMNEVEISVSTTNDNTIDNTADSLINNDLVKQANSEEEGRQNTGTIHDEVTQDTVTQKSADVASESSDAKTEQLTTLNTSPMENVSSDAKDGDKVSCEQPVSDALVESSNSETDNVAPIEKLDLVSPPEQPRVKRASAAEKEFLKKFIRRQSLEPKKHSASLTSSRKSLTALPSKPVQNDAQSNSMSNNSKPSPSQQTVAQPSPSKESPFAKKARAKREEKKALHHADENNDEVVHVSVPTKTTIETEMAVTGPSQSTTVLTDHENTNGGRRLSSFEMLARKKRSVRKQSLC